MAEGALPPGGMIGILGGGQLGRMLALSAARLGLRCHVYSDDSKAPGFDVATTKTFARFDDRTALETFAQSVDVATIEFENVPAEALAIIAAQTPVHPSPEVLAISQDRMNEKNFLLGHGIPVAQFESVETLDDLKKALETIGYPALLKTRRFGYDGKGQLRLERESDIAQAAEHLKNGPVLVEAFVNFVREISVVLVRDRAGTTAAYDPSENTHRSNILIRSVVPSGASDSVLQTARQTAERIAQKLDFVGVCCVEFFERRDDHQLVVNEIAPRVHNSGHWTMDACIISQFENHIRAVAGWPLGTTERHSNAEMINLLGDDAARWQEWARDGHVALHLYGKDAMRAGRKMGHITRLNPLNMPT